MNDNNFIPLIYFESDAWSWVDHRARLAALPKLDKPPFISLEDFEREAFYWKNDCTGMGDTALSESMYPEGEGPPPKRHKREKREAEDEGGAFKLSAPAKPFRKGTFDNNSAKPAKALFAGADCLAGQLDLWNADGPGEPPPAEPKLVFSYGSVPIHTEPLKGKA